LLKLGNSRSIEKKDKKCTIGANGRGLLLLLPPCLCSYCTMALRAAAAVDSLACSPPSRKLAWGSRRKVEQCMREASAAAVAPLPAQLTLLLQPRVAVPEPWSLGVCDLRCPPQAAHWHAHWAWDLRGWKYEGSSAPPLHPASKQAGGRGGSSGEPKQRVCSGVR
jgi:hypothetical protein